MTDAAIDQLRQAVEAQHGGKATHIRSVCVDEEHDGETVSGGNVAVFNLKNSPSKAWRAYAWSGTLPKGKRRVFAVLDTIRVNSPSEAVKAAIAAEQTAEK